MMRIAAWLATIACGAVATVSAVDPQSTDWDRVAKRMVKPLLSEDESGRMMTAFVERHLEPMPLPASAQAWIDNRERLRGQIAKTLGIDKFIASPAELKITSNGVLEREGYRIEKITFESYPGMAVPALLYLPQRSSGRVPGIVSIAGHVYGLGKAADFLQQRNVNLALRGCVVLAYDYMDCGERNTGPDPRNGKPYGGGNDHGIRLFSHSLHNPTGLEVLEAIRAVDVLSTRPEVDPNRIGFTGESGGGNSTYWVSAIDPRIQLSVPVSCLTSFDYWIRNDRNWDWHQRPWGIRRHADIGQLLALHAPRPLVAISSLRGTDDHEFPWEDADRSFAWAQSIYQMLDADDAAVHHESSTGHGYQEDKRLLLYAAVERWLKPPMPLGPKELQVRIESFDDLKCGLPTTNRTYFDIYREWTSAIPRKQTHNTRDDVHADRLTLRERLGWPDTLPAAKLAQRGKLRDGNFEYHEYRCETEPGIAIPLLEIIPLNPRAERVVVLCRDLEQIRPHLAAQKRVILLEWRGTGSVPPSGGALRNWAWFFGRPVTGMHAFDLSQVARALQEQAPASSLELDADTANGWIALLAAAVEPSRWKAGHYRLPFGSLHEDIQSKGDRSLADIPGLLEHLDVSHLKAMASSLRDATRP
ncbi:MAG: hypothetical protein RIS70_4201 [Planctomycetota bacterium]